MAAAVVGVRDKEGGPAAGRLPYRGRGHHRSVRRRGLARRDAGLIVFP
jgi:hypothetical protein